MPTSREPMRKLRDGSKKPSSKGLFSVHHEDSLAAARCYSGEIFWELRDGKTGELQDSGHRKNVVTLDASILIARLLKSPPTPNVSEPKFGIFALAIGTGNISWDPMNPPAATSTQRSLYNELARKQISVASFVDVEGSISGIPTNIVDFTTTFSESEAVGPLTEMGLLGGDVDTNMSVTNPILPPNGTYDTTVNVVGKDILVNYLTFQVINKPSTSTLSWTWRITT
ncbi:MAG TPA: hypothetical protein VIE65_13790 [Methylobacter sp.]